jgi:hypothetical protein
MSPLATIALVVAGIGLMAYLWRAFFADLWKVLREGYSDPLPPRNEGGGYHQPDGTISKDPEGRDVIGRQ